MGPIDLTYGGPGIKTKTRHFVHAAAAGYVNAMVIKLELVLTVNVESRCVGHLPK